MAKITFGTRLGGRKGGIMLMEFGGIKREAENHITAYPLSLETGLVGVNPPLFSYLFSTGRQSNTLTKKNHILI